MFRLGKRRFKRVNVKGDKIHNLKAYLIYRKIKEGGESEKFKVGKKYFKAEGEQKNYLYWFDLSFFCLVSLF